MFFLAPALFPDGRHMGNAVGVLGGQVLGFGAVFGEVVHGSRAPAFADDLALASVLMITMGGV